MRTVAVWISATAALLTFLISYQSTMPAGDPHGGERAQCAPAPAGSTPAPVAPGCGPDDHQGRPGERK